MTGYETACSHLRWFQRDEKRFMEWITSSDPTQFVYMWHIIPELIAKKGMPSHDYLVSKYDEESLQQYVRSYTGNLQRENRLVKILLCFTFIQELNENG